MENFSHLKTLSPEEVIEFVLARFEKGAECFNGNWWGGSHTAVAGSTHGFDVQVIQDSIDDTKYHAIAYGYKNSLCDVDMKKILVNKFALPFFIGVMQKNANEWIYIVRITDGDNICLEQSAGSKIDAHREAVKVLRSHIFLPHFQYQ